MKLAHVSKVVEELTRAGIPEGAIVPIGILELSCLTLYLFPRTSILGTFLPSGYMGGAVVTHIIGHQSFLPPLVAGILMFASAYLRHAELRDFVPFRNSRFISGKASPRTASVPSRL
jgi:DoxX-like family